MQPLQREKVHFTVAKAIEKHIKDNGLKKGDPLPSEGQMAQMLQIGRSSVREGLRLLEGMGLVEARPGKGIFVDKTRELLVSFEIEPGRESFLEVNDIRETLECKAARLFIQNALPEDWEGLLAAYDTMQKVYENKQSLALADLDFHSAMYRGTHNSYLRQTLESITFLFFHAWAEPYGKEDAFRASYVWHKDLYQALVEGDENKADRAIHNIIEHGNAAIAQYVPPLPEEEG